MTEATTIPRSCAVEQVIALRFARCSFFGRRDISIGGKRRHSYWGPTAVVEHIMRYVGRRLRLEFAPSGVGANGGPIGYTFFMWRVVRLTLIWLLAAALPFQGLSAATMVCGEHDHVVAQTSRHSQASMAGASHWHTQSELAVFDHSHFAKPALDKSGAHKCSACGSCCLNAVVRTEAVVFDRVKLRNFYAPLVARTLAAFVSEGLERPPRFFLA